MGVGIPRRAGRQRHLQQTAVTLVFLFFARGLGSMKKTKQNKIKQKQTQTKQEFVSLCQRVSI